MSIYLPTFQFVCGCLSFKRTFRDVLLLAFGVRVAATHRLPGTLDASHLLCTHIIPLLVHFSTLTLLTAL